ncbi:MAG TPA: PHD finger domain-containing protein [Thermoplasmata archaeon]|nr:PHD finger domain-containing protein [Thermoplasmata archaeon]
MKEPTTRHDPSHLPTSWRENARIVLPLFFVGAAAFVVSVFLFQAAGALHPTRVPLWLLSASIGVVATAGATTALVFGDFSEPEPSLADSALRSGEYVLIPRAEWERSRYRSMPSVDEQADGDSLPELGPAVPSPEAPAIGPETVAPSEEASALWRESEYTPTAVRRAGQMSRATDRLAEQVDELVRELDLQDAPEPLEPGSAPVPRLSRPRQAMSVPPARAPAHARPSEAVATELARQEYESLLRQLKVDAEHSSRGTEKPRSLVCSACGRGVGVDELWEACPACWRTYCPDCLGAIHPDHRPFVCPQCGHRKE